MSIRLLIADDHRLILQALRRALTAVDGIEVVGEARVGSQVLPLIARTDPDLVLVDIRMPELDGLACIERALREYPNVKFVVLSAFTDRQHIDEAFARGATAYIAKNADPADLVEGLRRAAAGESFELGVESGSAEDPDGLTERELQMLRAVAGGLSNKAISKEFWVTEQTVKFHLTNIYRKLGVGNRTEATRYAFSRGIVDSYANDGTVTAPADNGAKANAERRVAAPSPTRR
jgi:DNA-binding NarL/FixJ family response regulator